MHLTYFAPCENSERARVGTEVSISADSLYNESRVLQKHVWPAVTTTTFHAQSPAVRTKERHQTPNSPLKNLFNARSANTTLIYFLRGM